MVVKTYEKCMGDTDIYEKCYQSWIKNRKWAWKVILHFIDLAAINSWFLYKCTVATNKVFLKKEKYLLQFELEIAEALPKIPCVRRKVLNDNEKCDKVYVCTVKMLKFYHISL